MNNYGDTTVTTTRIINLERAEAASMALTTYMEAKGLDRVPCPQSENEAMTDLLTDLKHFSATSGVDFSAAVRISEYHYDEESNRVVCKHRPAEILCVLPQLNIVPVS